MRIFGWGDLGPVGRFSIALAAILFITALVVAGVSSVLLDRYVQDETSRFTTDAVVSHFGPVFKEDVFKSTRRRRARAPRDDRGLPLLDLQRGLDTVLRRERDDRLLVRRHRDRP